jgi:enoyl-CoA hydratase
MDVRAQAAAAFAVGFVFRSAPYEATSRDDKALAEVTGDWNPIHWDPGFAARTRFGRPLVHGLTLVGRLIGFMVGELGRVAEDRYAIYESQSLRFLAPVYFGDSVQFEIEVLDWQPDSCRLVMASRIYKLDSERTLVTDGETRIRLFPFRDQRKEAA